MNAPLSARSAFRWLPRYAWLFAVTALCHALCFLTSSARAAPPPLVGLETTRLPEPLRPWVDWVLSENTDASCAFVQREQDVRRCTWSSSLSLTLGDDGGRFEQAWHLDRPGSVVLPGDAKHWPLDVMVNGKPEAVLDRDGKPQIYLERGSARVAGTFVWDSLPSSLAVASDTALISLRVKGALLEQFERTQDGSVFLKRTADANDEESLTIGVSRRITDDVPLLLETVLTLNVSGRAREVVLGKALTDRFIPLSLESELPVRIEPDRRLRMQIRPGTFTVRLIARHDGPASELTRPAPDGPWADGNESWVFEARPEVRVVVIEGPQAIDPQQTTLPKEWKRLPAYAMPLGTTLRLVEKQRGEAGSNPILNLTRTYWLDFDGNGYTVRDTMGGTWKRPGRLEMEPDTVLGRVMDHGQDQFITRLTGATRSGIELRDPQISLVADSRIPGARLSIPAVSWNADFESVSSRLQLPPGWRLFHASGVDSVDQSWLKQWTLLDLFIALICVLAIARLFGWPTGGIALAVLVLTFPEPSAPKYVWLFVIFGEALARVLKTGRLARVLRLYRLGAWIVLFAVTVPFAVQQARAGLHPTQEDTYAHMRADKAENRGAQSFPDGSPPMLVPPPAPLEAADSVVQGLANANVNAKAGAPAPVAQGIAKPKASGPSGVGLGGLDSEFASSSAPLRAKARRHEGWSEANVVVQTGPGLPNWSWHGTTFHFNGPVQRGQWIRLWLMPPWMNLVLAIVEVVLLAAMIVLILFPSGLPRRLGGRGAVVAAVFFALFPMSTTARAADIPSQELLGELKTRLRPPVECQPQCGSIARLALEATPSNLRLRLQVTAGAYAAIPIPGDGEPWMPNVVLLDGQPAETLARNAGKLWLGVTAGRHEVLLEGPLPRREAVPIGLPLVPHHVTYRAVGWRLDGVHEDGIADSTLQLTRTRTRAQEVLPASLEGQDAGTTTDVEAVDLPPFVQIQRTVSLGLKWEVETRVVRVTPAAVAVVLEIPLLPGESVTSADLRVVHGRAQINMPPQAKELSWHSTLAEQPTVRIEAPRTQAWSEVWRLAASPIYHVGSEGIQPVEADGAAGTNQLEWRAWPGEAVVLRIARPEGAPGQTLTIDNSQLSLHPSLRSTEAVLRMQVRASRGGEHTIVLPQAARLTSMTIDGRAQPMRQDGARVSIPIVPALQTIELKWSEPTGLGAVFRTPVVDLGAESVNAEVAVNLPGERWPLWLSGPRVGPTVLFWSALVVLVLVAAGLGRSNLAVLGIGSWIVLALGLSQVHVAAAGIVVGWMLFMGWRQRRASGLGNRVYDLVQVAFVFVTLAALGVLVAAVVHGLLEMPDMEVAGNGSTQSSLVWFQDRAGQQLPRASIVSMPLLGYRIAMLVWSLWLAFAALRWVKWAWVSLVEHGAWRPFFQKKAPADGVTGS